MQIVPDESDSVWPLIHMGYEWMLQNAKDYIYMQTPYFVPPTPFGDEENPDDYVFFGISAPQ